MFQIGFTDRDSEAKTTAGEQTEAPANTQPRPSLVKIHFPDRNMNLAYYNDQFDLHKGDLVYVDGKLEGLQGYVTDVSYNFKIKVSDYHKVIAVADTTVTGRFYFAGSHLVSFDREALDYEKVCSWFCAPGGEDDYVSGFDDSSFPLNDLSKMHLSEKVAQRGHDYYLGSRVRYISLDGTHGRAIVTGTQPYQIEFEYENGEISRLVCNCFCTGTCKHEFAAMLQLAETLEVIEKQYAAEYEKSRYFAAVENNTLLQFAIGDREKGSVLFDA